MNCRWIACAVLGGMMSIGSSADAIVIADAGSGAPLNNTAPTDDPGWDRVGSFSGGTGVYLGNGWVLTARHVTTGSTFTLNGNTYNYVTGTGQTLANPSGFGLSAETDLWMGQFTPATGSPALPSGVLTVRGSTPTTGTLGTMIGTGKTQTSDTATSFYVNSDTSPWTWGTPSFPGANPNFHFTGFYRNGERDKKWATSPVAYLDGKVLNDLTIAGRDVRGFGTRFNEDANGGIVSENDSGSALFIQNGGVWELAGIAHALLLTYNGQSQDPSMANVVLYGNYSFYSDLSFYADQINTVVPEPGSLAMLGGLAGGLLLRRRR